MIWQRTSIATAYNSSVQLREAIRQARTQLDHGGIAEARLSAEVLAFAVLGCDRAYLFSHPERELTEAEQLRYAALVARRVAGEPLQYLLGRQEFYGREFYVSPAVLIPRPETEHLIEAVVELARQATHVPLQIVDVGTGSGAIAVTLALHLAHAQVLAVDLSAEALAVARTNAERWGAQVKFVISDLLTEVAEAEFDLVVSNPPYVPHRDAAEMDRTVVEHEPHLALFGGPDGLAVIRRLIPQAAAKLRRGGWLAMEIGYGEEAAVRQLLADWDEVAMRRDLAGIERIVVARKR